ncbi:MAG: response regulator [Vicinamibacterales bacterium]
MAGDTPLPADAAAVVLIVDDDEPILRILAQWVTRLGYAPRIADSADAAIAELERGGIDVALCDIRMPGKDGIWLSNQIRERFSSVAVVLVTGLDELDVSFTLRPGIVGYVTKPFERDAISAALQAALQWRQQPVSGPAAGGESLFELVERWEPAEQA